MGKDLVLVGGGHAHMTVLLRLGEFVRSGHRVTLISSAPDHYYSGMGPGLLSGIYQPRQARFHIKKMAQAGGAAFIEGDAIAVDPARRVVALASGREVRYDIASFNTGSGVALAPRGAHSERIVPVKPILNLCRARHAILERCAGSDLRIAVIGGGAAGVEIAANLWRLLCSKPRRGEIFLLASDRILSRFPERVRALALNSLCRRGVTVIEGTRAEAAEDGAVRLSDGTELVCDFVFLATGVAPSPLFSASGLPTGEGCGLLVNSFLQSTAHPELFGGGDCISLSSTPLSKVGVYAVRQNPILFHNLMAALEGGDLQPFQDIGDYLLILNMGDGTGIAWKRKRVLSGRLPFLFKDFIDNRFMKKFQISGERSDPEENAD